MNESKAIERSFKKPLGVGWMSILGGTALLLAASIVVAMLPDIKRYIKISRM